MKNQICSLGLSFGLLFSLVACSKNESSELSMVELIGNNQSSVLLSEKEGELRAVMASLKGDVRVTLMSELRDYIKEFGVEDYQEVVLGIKGWVVRNSAGDYQIEMRIDWSQLYPVLMAWGQSQEESVEGFGKVEWLDSQYGDLEVTLKILDDKVYGQSVDILGSQEWYELFDVDKILFLAVSGYKYEPQFVMAQEMLEEDKESFYNSVLLEDVEVVDYFEEGDSGFYEMRVDYEEMYESYPDQNGIDQLKTELFFEYDKQQQLIKHFQMKHVFGASMVIEKISYDLSWDYEFEDFGNIDVPDNFSHIDHLVDHYSYGYLPVLDLLMYTVAIGSETFEAEGIEMLDEVSMSNKARQKLESIMEGDGESLMLPDFLGGSDDFYWDMSPQQKTDKGCITIRQMPVLNDQTTKEVEGVSVQSVVFQMVELDICDFNHSAWDLLDVAGHETARSFFVQEVDDMLQVQQAKGELVFGKDPVVGVNTYGKDISTSQLEAAFGSLNLRGIEFDGESFIFGDEYSIYMLSYYGYFDKDELIEHFDSFSYYED